MPPRSITPRLFLGALLFVVVLPSARAQWVTQSLDMVPGWNAVYLHVDATHTTLEDMIVGDPGNPIEEVWLWNPTAASLQFVQDPQVPTGTGSDWFSWDKSSIPQSTLQRLVGNTAYLVRISGTLPYTWQIQGRPVPPVYRWTSTGLNFIGFSTPTGVAPDFEVFLAQAPDSLKAGEFYRYSGSVNPSILAPILYRNVPVERGEAFWIGPTNTYNRYFGTFEVDLRGASGVRFGDGVGQSSVRLRNSTTNALTVSLEFLDSDAPPAGQPSIAAAPPLLVRGDLNLTNLTYAYTQLPVNGSQSWLLQPAGEPGSEIDVVLGVNRGLMSGPEGTLFAGILRFTDSLGHLQVDIPTSAEVASRTGLWVGEASVTNVGHYLVTYERALQTNYVLAPNGEQVVESIETNLVSTAGGQYVVSEVDTSPGGVARPFPLRLILHNPAAGNPKLLQRVYFGTGPQTNFVVATSQAALDPSLLSSARRVSAAHLPWTESNLGWPFVGQLDLGQTITATVANAFNDQASNPFLHTYHPDHDNLDASFDSQEPQGRESYEVWRAISLTVDAPQDNFSSLTAESGTLVGLYSESVTISGTTNESRVFQSSGAFILNRVSDVDTLTSN